MPLTFSPPFQVHQITHLRLREEDRQFLLTTGLPEDAIPFLSFQNAPAVPLRSVPEIWGIPESLKPSLMRYYEFGFDSAGNPICFDAHDSCKIAWLDHEDGFRPTWVNDYITDFVACLATLQDAFDMFEAAGGDTDIVWERGFDPERYEKLTATFAEIDEKALTQGFWPYILADFCPR